MTWEDFDQRVQKIEIQGDLAKSIIVDPAYADLFRCCIKEGKTQQQIADRMGKQHGVKMSRQQIARLVKFGAFLDFAPAGANFKLPAYFCEWEFRQLWDKTTGKKDELRFAQIVEMISEETNAPQVTSLTKQLVDDFGDWQWYKVSEVAKVIEVGEGYGSDVELCKTLKRICRGNDKDFGMQCELNKATPFTKKEFRLRQLPKAKTKRDEGQILCAVRLRPLVVRLLKMTKDKHATAEYSRSMVSGYVQELLSEMDKIIKESKVLDVAGKVKDGKQVA